MALINITEFSELARNVDGHYLPTGVYNDNVVVQEIGSLSGTSQESSTFAVTTSFLQLNVDADTRIAIGKTPTAGSTSTRIPAGAILIVGVPRNKGFRIAAVTA